jgi:Flp pilus assembly pilin Flp
VRVKICCIETILPDECQMTHHHPTQKIMSRLRAFLRDQSAAVTVDWVAITGAVLAMVIGFFNYFNGEMSTVFASLISLINRNL